MRTKRNLKMWLVMSVLLAGMAPAIAAGGTIYVDADASPGGDGSSWADAYTTIQEGIDAASEGDTVLVADGIYTGAGNKNLDFNGKAITVKSQNGPANCIIDCESSGRGFHFHTGESANSIVNGFTIRKGNVGLAFGGGIRCDNSSPTIANCKITKNYSDNYGGGMYNYYAHPMITNCTFSGNSAPYYGGGVYNSYSSPTVANCTFSGNSATYGGGMRNYDSSPTVTNCTFSGNSAYRGGGMYNATHSNSNVTNCIFWGNTALTGAQIYNEGASFATVSYSDVQDGYTGTGNIDNDPSFIGPNGLDGIPGTADDEEDNVHLRGYSPCINAGDPGGDYSGQVDIDGQPRVAYGRVDMGADEVFPAAGDFEPDGDVDFADFAIFANHWLAGVE